MVYCTKCGKQLSEHDKFCSSCGSINKEYRKHPGIKNEQLDIVVGSKVRLYGTKDALTEFDVYVPERRKNIRRRIAIASCNSFDK